jgi:aspartyl-tRNA(Asn)/glutamyl-tRNA(Gln) amidotransferase subunit B
MPDKRRVAYRGLGLSEDYARILTETRERSDYFEAALSHTHHPRVAANLLIGEILPRTGLAPILLPPKSLGEIADMAGEKQISTASARRLIPLCEDGGSVADTARAENMMLITDAAEIEAMVEQALSENPDVAEQLAEGNTKVLSMLMGAVMRISCGRAEPRLTQTLIDRLAEKY